MSDDHITISLDIDDLDLGEAEDFEAASGMALLDLKGKQLPVKALTALVWIVKRRSNPKFTLKQARRVKVTSIDFVSDPTEAKPESGT